MLNPDLIDHILTTIPRKSIGLIGDLFLDRYLDIDGARNEPSVETGLTAYQVRRIRNYPGALGTVLSNLVALGVGKVEPVTVLGEDGEGYDLLRVLKSMPGVCLEQIVFSSEIHTPTYTKPMLEEAGQVRELNRLDVKNLKPLPKEIEDKLLSQLMSGWANWDAVLVLDQVRDANTGVLTDRVRECVEGLAQQSPEKFVLADSRERIDRFQFVSVKPNEREAQALPNRPEQRRFITHGEAGMELWEPGSACGQKIPAYSVSGPTDICGAGDSCSAGIACAMVSGATPSQAAAFGNLIASITVQQLGVTGTATPSQVRERWQQVATAS